MKDYFFFGFGIFLLGILAISLTLPLGSSKCIILKGVVNNVVYDSGFGKHYWTGRVIDQFGRKHAFVSYEAVSKGDIIKSKSFSCGGAINQPF